jgi:hypothetical protein
LGTPSSLLPTPIHVIVNKLSIWRGGLLGKTLFTAGFGGACRPLNVYFLGRQRASLRLRLVQLGIAGIVFYFVWSIGIVGVTHLASNLETGFSKAGVAFFYGTSGTQFFHFHEAAIFCLIAFIPAFVLNLLANVMLRKWLFPKRPHLVKS